MASGNSKLIFRLNACPVCLICIECNELYGELCKCNAKELKWNKNKEGYEVDFRHKLLKNLTAKIRNLKYDPLFVSWFYQNISANIEISEQQSDINICHKCNNKYDYAKRTKPAVLKSTKKLIKNKVSSNTEKSQESVANETIKLPLNDSNVMNILPLEKLPDNSKSELAVYVTLICFNQFQHPRKKLDGALKIPYVLDNISNFGNIEEEILSRKLPESWGSIEIGLICYQISSIAKADQYDLKASGSIEAFVAEAKKNKKLQLCVYQDQEKVVKRKAVVYGSAVVRDQALSGKKLRLSENESEIVCIINQAKNKIRESLQHCEYHLQGCLISNGRHLKLDEELITIWARAMANKMVDVDEKNPPKISLFDKNRYQYPPNKRLPTKIENNEFLDTSTIPIMSITSQLKNLSSPETITIHTKKVSPFKSNIRISEKMTFNDLILFAFPKGAPDGKRFIIKSSPDTDAEEYLPDQLMNDVLRQQHADIWFDLETVLVNFDDLF